MRKTHPRWVTVRRYWSNKINKKISKAGCIRQRMFRRIPHSFNTRSCVRCAVRTPFCQHASGFLSSRQADRGRGPEESSPSVMRPQKGRIRNITKNTTLNELNMYVFHDAVLSVVPEFYCSAFAITDKNEMCKLFESICCNKYNNALWFNTGIGNNSISSIIKIENDDFLIGSKQINIQRVWGLLTDDIYDDILLLELEKSVPYEIDGEEYYSVAVIEKKEIVPYEAVLSGYVRYKNKVYRISDLNIQERLISNDYRVIAIAPFYNCTNFGKNDKFLEKLQTIDAL